MVNWGKCFCCHLCPFSTRTDQKASALHLRFVDSLLCCSAIPWVVSVCELQLPSWRLWPPMPSTMSSDHPEMCSPLEAGSTGSMWGKRKRMMAASWGGPSKINYEIMGSHAGSLFLKMQKVPRSCLFCLVAQAL